MRPISSSVRPRGFVAASSSRSDKRSQDVIRYFVDRLSGQVGRTFLVKLAYMADLEAHRQLGRSLTNLEYRVNNYGPFDPAFFDAVAALEAGGDVEQSSHVFPDGSRGYRFESRRIRPYEFSPPEEAVLSFVLESFGDGKLSDLLDAVYETKPFVHARDCGAGTRIPLEIVDGDGARELGGITLEKALEGRAAASRGEFTELEEWLSELPSEDRRARKTGD